MNGLTFLALIVLAIGIVLAYRAGRIAGRRETARTSEPMPFSQAALSAPRESSSATTTDALPAPSPTPVVPARFVETDTEKSRLIVAYEGEAARLRTELATLAANGVQLEAFAEDRRALLDALAESRGETARYRQLVVDFETNAPPTLLGGPGSPDDLKLIVGVGPMLERMLQQLGVFTYRQIAQWSEHDIDVFDAKLPEFPGRIRRDGWVVQARALHQSKFGERP